MKKPFLIVFAALAFFACSGDPMEEYNPSSSSNNDSSSSESNNSSSSGNSDLNATIDINPQVYVIDCNEDLYNKNACNFNQTYDGSGVIKEVVRDYDSETDREEIVDIIGKIGTITDGKINLEFYTPKEESLSEEGYYTLWDLALYDNADNIIGYLLLMNSDFDPEDNTIAFYVYSSKDYKHKDEYDLLPNQNVKFVTDLDIKKGWNLHYENDRYEYEGEEMMYVVTKTTDPSILKGKDLRWYLADPSIH